MKNDKWLELNAMVKIKGEDGQYQYDKDKEAVKSYFIDHINKKTRFFHDIEEKLDYLFENGYYNKRVFKKYSMRNLKRLYKIAYDENFRFQSYMSAFKFYNNYALWSRDGEVLLERYEDRIIANAVELGRGNMELAKNIVIEMINQRIQPATPTFLNAGKANAGKFVSCFLLEAQDSTEGLMYVNESTAQLSRFGGGVSINLSKARGEDERIGPHEGASTSVVGNAKILEAIATKFNQTGQREGAVAVYLNGFHSDIRSFLATKKINADESIRLKTLSLGIIMHDKFYELVEKDSNWYTFYPKTVHDEYGIHLDDMQMDVWYDKLVANPNVRKKMMGKARTFLEEIGATQLESGYPYLFNKDVVNASHMLRDIGTINFSNLCVEICQLTTPSKIMSYKGEDEFGYDISCNLASLNTARVMEGGNVENTINIAIDILNSVSDITSIDEVPSVKKANEAFHSIGLGAMNLHGYFAKNHISYESKEALDFANVFFSMVRYYALKRSMEISKVKGPFDYFEKSEYAKGKALTQYLSKDIAPVTERVKSLFDGIPLITKEDWIQLNEDIMEHGIRNAYLMAIAPTGSISYVNNSTPSVFPITEKIETRVYGDSKTNYPMPYMNQGNFWFYKEAYNTDMYKMIDLISVIQRHVDQSISTTLYVDSNVVTDGKMAKYFMYAHKRGLKTIYYARTKVKSNVEECESCSV